MKKLLKIVAVVLVVLIVATFLALTLFLNRIVKTSVETGGPRMLGVSTTLEDVDLRLLSGKFKLNNLFVGNPEGFKSSHMFKLGGLTVDMEMKSLLTDTIVINEIMIDAPQITYEIGLRGSNIGKLMETVQPEESAAAPEDTAIEEQEDADSEPAKKVIIKSLVIRDGKVSVAAQMLGGHGATLPLPTIHLTDIGKEQEGGANPAMVIGKVLSAVTKAVIATASKSGQLVGKGVGAAADLAGKGVGAAADIAGKGVGAAAEAAGKGVGAAADIAGKGIGAAAEAAGKGVGAAADIAGRGVGAAAGAAGKGVGAVAGAAGKGVGAAANIAGKGVGAAAGAAGKAGAAVGKGAAKVAGGITGFFKKKTDKEETDTPVPEEE